MSEVNVRRVKPALKKHALIDNDDKGVAASLRLSPHYYNTEAEVDLVADAVSEIVAGGL